MKVVSDVVVAVHFKVEFENGYRYDAEDLHRLLVDLKFEGSRLAANNKLEKVLLKLQVIAVGALGWTPGPKLDEFINNLEIMLCSERNKAMLEYKDAKVA